MNHIDDRLSEHEEKRLTCIGTGTRDRMGQTKNKQDETPFTEETASPTQCKGHIESAMEFNSIEIEKKKDSFNVQDRAGGKISGLRSER